MFLSSNAEIMRLKQKKFEEKNKQQSSEEEKP